MDYTKLDVEAGANPGARRCCDVTSACARRVLVACAVVWACLMSLLVVALRDRYGWSPAKMYVAAVGSGALVIGSYTIGRSCGKVPRAPRAIDEKSTAEEVLPEPRGGITLLPSEEK